MSWFVKKIPLLVIILLGCYLFLCLLLYCLQEKLIFPGPAFKTPNNFSKKIMHEDVFITRENSVRLNAALFFRSARAATRTGKRKVIFYLHGNGEDITFLGPTARFYNQKGYDVFILDYRGYGKSGGKISSQAQIHTDIQAAYDWLKTRYKEEQITILGYSIGSGLAAKLACENQPRMLILLAPYYSLTDMLQHIFPFVPSVLLKYKFSTNEYIVHVKAPVVIFHGKKDKVVYFASSLKLQKLLKKSDKFFALENQGHADIYLHPAYQKNMAELLP